MAFADNLRVVNREWPYSVPNDANRESCSVLCFASIVVNTIFSAPILSLNTLS